MEMKTCEPEITRAHRFAMYAFKIPSFSSFFTREYTVAMLKLRFLAMRERFLGSFFRKRIISRSVFVNDELFPILGNHRVLN
jgi:hypothetical protein